MFDILSTLLHEPDVAPTPTPLPTDLGDIDPRWASLELTWLDTPAGRVRALVGGDPAGDAPVHLMVHGLGASALSWLDTAAALVDRGAAVVAPDLPGFGRAEPSAEFGGSLDDLEAALLAVVDTLDADRFVLHGNSLGGLLALRVADGLRDRLDGLVLAAPAVPVSWRHALPVPLGTVFGFGLAAVPGLGELMVHRMAHARQPMDERMIEAVFHDTERATSPAMQEVYAGENETFRTARWRQHAMLAATRSILPFTATGRSWRDLATDPGCPVLVVWGDDDRLLPGGMLAEIRKRRPEWRVEVLDAAGHAPHADRPDRYAELAMTAGSRTTRLDLARH